MTAVGVRYIVNDIAVAVAFYTKQLGFTVHMHPGPGFAALDRGDLRLLLNTPGSGGGAGRPMPDGRMPEPGGWARIQLRVENLDGEVARLSSHGVVFRSGIMTGRGGRQIVLDDPSGNAVELFEPTR